MFIYTKCRYDNTQNNVDATYTNIDIQISPKPSSELWSGYRLWRYLNHWLWSDSRLRPRGSPESIPGVTPVSSDYRPILPPLKIRCYIKDNMVPFCYICCCHHHHLYHFHHHSFNPSLSWVIPVTISRQFSQRFDKKVDETSYHFACIQFVL